MSCVTRIFRRGRRGLGDEGEKGVNTAETSHGTKMVTEEIITAAPRTFPRFTISVPGLNFFSFGRKTGLRNSVNLQPTTSITDLRSAGLTFDNMSLSDQSARTAIASDGGEPPKKKIKREEIVCTVCREVLDNDDFVQPCRGRDEEEGDADCKRAYCYDCIKQAFEVALRDPQVMPARCHKVFYTGLADGLLSDADLARYKKKFEELSAPHPLYCPIPTCSDFVPGRLVNTTDNKAACPTCATEVCTKCKKIATDAHACNRDEENAMLKKFGYKECPNCGTAVGRLFGCAHMECHCGAHWCWFCQQPEDICDAEACLQPQMDEEDDQDDDDDEEAAGPGLEQEPTVPALPIDPAILASTDDNKFTNLDDPDANDFERDYEEDRLELNEEPEYHGHSVSECRHYFSDFDINGVPDKWLRGGVDKANGITLECMLCFNRTMFVPGKLMGEKKKSKISKKASAYECKRYNGCRIVVCWDCKLRHESPA